MLLIASLEHLPEAARLPVAAQPELDQVGQEQVELATLSLGLVLAMLIPLAELLMWVAAILLELSELLAQAHLMPNLRMLQESR